MDTSEVERPSLVDKLLRRKSRPSETTDKNEKTIDEIAAGVKSEIEKLTRLCNQNVSVNGVNNGGSEKPKESIESLKTEPAVPEEKVNVEDKRKNSESSEKLVINNEVGQVKLTDIINNSIKEAVLNIVKAGVCPAVENLETPPKEARKTLPEINVEEAQNVENKPKINKNSLSSLTPKTFDSHSCRNQFQASTHCEPLPVAPAPRKVSRETSTREINPRETNTREINPRETNTRETNSRETNSRDTNSRETNSRETNSRESREKKVKSRKQKDGKAKESSCPTIVRAAPNKTSHVRTDNRRMTGNVNIYICSEANGKSNDSTAKAEDEGPAIEEIETDSQTKSNESNLSISTSKLVAALKRRQLKNAADESLDFVSEAEGSTSSVNPSNDARIEAIEDDGMSDNDDDENDESASSDPSTPPSRNGSFDENDQSNRLDFPNAIEARYAEREIHSHKNYNANQFEPWTGVEGRSYEKRKPEDPEENCFCCSTKRCVMENPRYPDQERRNIWPGAFFHRESSDNRCLCVIEEKEEDCCVDKQVPGEKFTVCGGDPTENAKIFQEDKKPLENKFSRSASGSSNPEAARQQNSEKKVSGQLTDRKSSPAKGSKDSVGKSAAKGSKDSVGKSATKVPEGNRVDSATKKTSNGPGISDTTVRKVPPVVEEKVDKTSFFRRTMNRAMNIVKNVKTENANGSGDKKAEPVPAEKSKPKENGSKETTAAKENDASSSAIAQSVSGTPSIPRNNSNENRSKSRISVALANRKHSAMKNSSLKNVPSGEEGKTKDQCPCNKSEEILECRSKLARSWNDCKCFPPETRETDNTSPSSSKLKPQTNSSRNENNEVEGRIGSTEKLEAKDPKACKCCPGCRGSLIECKCRLGQPLEPNSREFPTSDRRNATESGQPAEVHIKNQGRRDSNGNGPNGPKSMICIYCDNPRENCSCNAPIRKCPRCGLPLDVCTCKSSSCADCNGRQIFPGEDNKQTINVTAWKPRQEIARYFSRSPETVDHENCSCWQNSKPYGAGQLPYQKTGAFSDVIDELQQKISGSMYCKVCNKIDCRCRNDRANSPKKIKPGLSPIPEHGDRETPRRRSRSQSSPEKTCKCDPARRRNPKKSGPMKICDRCQTSPCRCRRAHESPENNPPAECYYCKSSPCICESVNEAGNSRPLRNGESLNRRRKDRSREGKMNGKIGNEDNDYSAPEKNGFVPRAGKQQRNRKHSYRASPNATRQKPSHPGERVR